MGGESIEEVGVLQAGIIAFFAGRVADMEAAVTATWSPIPVFFFCICKKKQGQFPTLGSRAWSNKHASGASPEGIPL